MGPEMTILECICQVLVFWAVCLGGWVTVKIIERHVRVTSTSRKRDGRVTPASQKCDTRRGRRAA